MRTPDRRTRQGESRARHRTHANESALPRLPYPPSPPLPPSPHIPPHPPIPSPPSMHAHVELLLLGAHGRDGHLQIAVELGHLQGAEALVHLAAAGVADVDEEGAGVLRHVHAEHHGLIGEPVHLELGVGVFNVVEVLVPARGETTNRRLSKQ